MPKLPMTAGVRAAVLTPRGTGAIAVIAVRGAGARLILARIAGPGAQTLAPGKTALVKVREASGGILDDALLVCLNDNAWELHIHGGVAVVEEALGLLQTAGAERLEAQSTELAELLAHPSDAHWSNGIGAEVLVTLPRALTPTAVRLLAAQAQNGLTPWAESWVARLQGGEPLWSFQSAAQWVLDRSVALQKLLDLPRVALVGPPNAGKSTLANALLGRPASITSDVAGTTRDWVDATGILAPRGPDGPQVAVTLVDTAGIRQTQDPIEKEAIARSHHQMSAADVVVVVLDGSVLPDVETSQWVARLTPQMPTLVALNKSDRPAVVTPSATAFPVARVAISALEHRGLETLSEALLRLLGLTEVTVGEPWAFTLRQVQTLDEAAKAHTLQEALALLADLLA